MSAFRNLKIKAKMLVSFLLVVVVMSGILMFSIFQLTSVSASYNNVIDHSLEARRAILEFISTYRDVRRMVMTMSSYTGYNQEKCESLYKEAKSICADADKCLDEYEAATRANTLFTEEDVTFRINKVNSIREKFKQYQQGYLEEMIEAAREAGSDPDSPEAVQWHAQSLVIIETGGQIATDIREASLDLRDTVMETANKAMDGAKGRVGTTSVMLACIAVAAIILSIVIALTIANMISKPIAMMTQFMKKAGSTGDISIAPDEAAQIKVLASAKDEIAELSNGSVMFVEHVTYIANELEIIAGGDLTSEIKLLSDRDAMGKSLDKMIKSFNEMFLEIKQASSQVSVGSGQISDGAQLLASGSSEQAATLEQLSASIDDISQKTKENAERTSNASKLADDIMKNAEKGTKQMEQMINAVNEINAANQNINKVIKAIDDIAFQTNILALNAAVEAARAGSAGKGFAIVAEEVRNLAGKSAESAKDTSELIANSIEKAHLGTQIAGETASSLNDIVSGITGSNKIIAEIARSSEEQTESINQISYGINSVTQVVQQSSAATEESAAASEQMNGQATMLEEMVRRFRLKESR